MRTTRWIAIAAAGAAVCTLAGCGGGSGKSTGATSLPNGEGPSTQTQGGFNRANIGTAIGKVTAVSGQEAKVATSTGTTVIAWSSTQTRFTTSTSTTRNAIKAGDCVSVGSAGGIAHSDATNGQSTPPAKVTAKLVTITSTSGCNLQRSTTGGFGGAGGAGAQGGPGGTTSSGEAPRPTGRPSFPSGSGRGGFPRGNFRGGFGTIGTVKSVGANSFVVAATFGNTTTTVTTTAATTYRSTGTGSASDVTAGTCVSAVGTKASSGVVDAFTVGLSSPVNGKCVATGGTPFAGGFGGPGAGGQPPGSGTTSG